MTSPVVEPQVLPVTLVSARGAAVQRVLNDWLAQPQPAPRAVIAEGALFGLDAPDDVEVLRLAAGCVCCLGLVPLRVTLVRLLRSVRPRSLLLVVASDEHLPRLRALLASGELGNLELVEPATADATVRSAIPPDIPAK